MKGNNSKKLKRAVSLSLDGDTGSTDLRQAPMLASTSSTGKSLSKDSQCAFSTSNKPPMLPSQTPLDVDENVQQPNANETNEGNITQSTAHPKLKSRSESHKGVNIGNAIDFCMEEWGLSKVMCITVDNAFSNDSAVSQLKKRLLKKNAFVLGGDAFHMRCCAHIIQLVVRDGLDAVQGSIKRIRDVKAFDRLEDIDNRFQVEFGDELPSEFDWHNARILCKFLKKFYDVTCKLSGCLYSTSSIYFLDIMKILKELHNCENSGDEIIVEMGKQMKNAVNEYMSSNDQACMGDNGSSQNANVEKCDNAMIEEDEEIDDYFIQMDEQKLALFLSWMVFNRAFESAFSTGGRALDQFRSSLLPTTAKVLIVAKIG
ncbi:hypothetical protein GH714_012700 [Hevea brasiliensis]|uniref:hAT-like transposase RNase-H fold domain-containing protein n=1 Tax=Hevea brasiliensis TaxID=3981 RepID=A0A6A6LNK3_HEVBR|nr:hypothetical protein GH714_012700 [Hevea brasiliensis]